ncbi:MAG: alpha-ketoacid dehydrogenase subunit beta [Cyclobacteriaceae bacterium]
MPEAAITYREAIKRGLARALKSDSRVFLMGEDVGKYGGAFAASKGLLAEFGPERIVDVPLSESGFTGAGIGAAIAGLKPIVEIMTINFSLLALDQLVNNAATLCHMSGGQVYVPLVVRMGCGPGRQLAAQHSHSWEPLFAMIPGLKVLSAGTHSDAEEMILMALQENNPVIILEYTSLLNRTEITTSEKPMDIQRAIIRRIGSDITLITYGTGVSKSLQAAQELEKDNVSAEVLDLRILRPIDAPSIISSAKKTRKILFIEDAWGTISIGAAVLSMLYTECFYELDQPIEHLSGLEVPTPYPLHLEAGCTPTVEDIVTRCKKILSHG